MGSSAQRATARRAVATYAVKAVVVVTHVIGETPTQTFQRIVLNVRDQVQLRGWNFEGGGDISVRDLGALTAEIDVTFWISREGGTKAEAGDVVTAAVRASPSSPSVRVLNVVSDVKSAVARVIPDVKREYRILQVLVAGGLVLGILVYAQPLFAWIPRGRWRWRKRA